MTGTINASDITVGTRLTIGTVICVEVDDSGLLTDGSYNPELVGSIDFAVEVGGSVEVYAVDAADLPTTTFSLA